MSATPPEAREENVPRNLRLLKELVEGQERSCGSTLRWGLVRDDDLSLWSALIIGPRKTPFADRVYSLGVVCGSAYPYVVPEVRFVSEINLDGVDQVTGVVDPKVRASSSTAIVIIFDNQW
ncbi:unnamed protein product [Timema podura]|uniref:UBC core domain-containing protein n=1 Tax=Timema podura TaxID=61482 RepID=A0ABN7NJ54_TIMPD|nr:unnamed protein product [Timema podura]